MQRGRFIRASVALCLYGAAVTAVPLVHNAWHDRAHGHGHTVVASAPAPEREEHGHRRSAHGGHGHDHVHEAAHSGAPAERPSDPDHGRGAPEHFGLALGPAGEPAPSTIIALLPAERVATDPTVHERSSFRTPEQARAPPRS